MTQHTPAQPNIAALLPRLARFLPADLFTQVRAIALNEEAVDETAQQKATSQLLKANRALEPLERVLIHYMPRYLAQLNPTPGQPHGELLHGSFMHADLKGFTAMTELLARQGQARGQEAMNQMLNRLFSALLDPLIASGGDLLIFAGDAALAYFPKQADNEDVLQAARAGLRMQRAIIPFATFQNEFGKCTLSMRIGVEQGTAYAGIVGSAERMELLVSGPGVWQAMHIEGQAQPGEVYLGPVSARIAAPHFTMQGAWLVDNLGDALGDYEISPPKRKRGGSIVLSRQLPDVLALLEHTLERVERLAPFLPADMLARLVDSGRRRRLEAEFRPVAVQYLNLLGLEELAIERGPELATEILQQYFLQAEKIISQHEGIVSQVDAYAKGFFLLNTYGAPKAHEGTKRYAVSAALQIAQMLTRLNEEFALDPPLTVRGGITFGLVFNGEIGARYRRESVIAGPAVNRGARLMSQAEPGQVILDADIWADVRSAFAGEELPPVELKGIEGRVVIINVRQIRYGTRLRPPERPLVGRSAEIKQLESALDAVKNGQGSVWFVAGETGLGKTALIAHTARQARLKGLTILLGRCQPHGKHIPLYPWLDMLAGWLDPAETGDLAVQQAHLSQELSVLNLTHLEAELAELLAFPQFEDTAALLSERDHNFEQALKTLIETLARKHPLIFILEDIHWLDRASKKLLESLLQAEADPRLMFLITGRGAANLPGNLNLIDLPPLNRPALLKVAQRQLGADSLDESLANWIAEQAGGNPLYAQELCQALKQADAVLLDYQSGEARWTRYAPGLPLSLHALLLARLDEMSIMGQDILKRAAVLGSEFSAEALVHLAEPRYNAQDVSLALRQAVQDGFLLDNQQGHYQFKHVLMQEAIYNTISFSQRQNWHVLAGNWLVSLQREAQYLPLIAYHYFQGDKVKKAARYGRMAGDRAKEQREYATALEYYQQVLALEGLPQGEEKRTLESMADVLAIQGNTAAALKKYTQAIALGNKNAQSKQAILAGDLTLLEKCAPDSDWRPWLMGSTAWLLAQQGQTEDSLTIIQRLLAETPAHSPIYSAILTLQESIQAKKPAPAYDSWLEIFIKTVLQRPIMPVDLLNLPADSLALMRLIIRRRKVTFDDLTRLSGQPAQELERLLDNLLAKGYLRQSQSGKQKIYQTNFDRKRKKRSSVDIWSVIDSGLE